MPGSDIRLRLKLLLPQQTFAGRNSENWNRENVFDGGDTTSGRMDKWRPQLDSAHRICPGCMSHEALTVVVDVPTGGELAGRKSENRKGSRMFS